MALLKYHHIRFASAPAGAPAEWEAVLARVRGVTKVSIDAAGRDVFVEYDLAQCSEEAIERWMVHEGFVLDDHLMERVKRGWVHYTEENEQDALKMGAHPHCEVEEPEEPEKKGPKEG